MTVVRSAPRFARWLIVVNGRNVYTRAMGRETRNTQHETPLYPTVSPSPSKISLGLPPLCNDSSSVRSFQPFLLRPLFSNFFRNKIRFTIYNYDGITRLTAKRSRRSESERAWNIRVFIVLEKRYKDLDKENVYYDLYISISIKYLILLKAQIFVFDEENTWNIISSVNYINPLLNWNLKSYHQFLITSHSTRNNCLTYI